jgi:glycine cleavage system aminomethyltransferase T
MGYVDSTMGNIDQQIMIKVRDKLLQARIVKFPFT